MKKNKKGRIIVFLLFPLLILILTLNLISSQSVSPLFLGVINRDYQATVTYLKKIKPLPIFSHELNKFKNIFGEKIEIDVFAKEQKIKAEIKKLETILEKNPDARDVLYQLYLLYQQIGNEKKANLYLKRAKTVDPFIN